MRGLIVGLAVSLWAGSMLASDIIVQKVRGEVAVRQGVTEVWSRVATGDVLKPDDTMKTGEKGSAVILVPDAAGNGAAKRIALPPQVIVDMSDIRQLSQEELMLKLAMEKVRSSSYHWKADELNIPNAAVVHGTDRGGGETLIENDIRIGILQMNGTRVLFENGYYPTCALKAMEVFRLYPALGERFENRLLVAEALERAELKGEALHEYGGILKLVGLKVPQEELVRGKIVQLRK
jgi:hypothetical protein